MKVKLLDKYIFSQVFIASIACIIIFMIIWIMPEILLKTVQRTINGSYTVEMAAKILLFELPKVLNIAIPVGMLLGTILTFDKLSKDSELTILRSCGISFKRIIASVMLISIFATFATFIVGSKLLPYAACKLKEVKDEYGSSQFVFPVKLKNGAMDKIIIVPKFDNNNIKDVIVLNFYRHEQEQGSSLLSSIIISDFVKYDHKDWTINSARKYRISEEGIFEEIEGVNNIKILGGERAKNAYKLMRYSIHRYRELTNPQISEYIKLLKLENMDDEYRFMLNKYIQRYSHSLMCILFAILGCMLGISRPREQRFVGMLIAVGIIFGYYITIPFLDLLAEKDILSPYITSTIAPVVAVILIFVFNKSKDL